MNLHPRLEDVLSTNWATQIKSAPELINILGLCTALTSKREVMALQLTDSRLPNKALLPNLLHLSNQGQAAFQQAHSDMYKISVSAYDIGRKNGYIDKIVNSFQNITAGPSKKRLERSLRGLEQHVDRTRAEGAMTKEKFDSWKDKTDILREAVANELSSTQKTVLTKEKHEKQLRYNVKAKERDVELAESRMEESKRAAESSKELTRYILETRRSRQTSTTMRMGGPLGITFNIFATIFDGALGIMDRCSFHDRLLEQREAEDRFYAQSEALRDCERHLAILQNNLDSAKSDVEKWEQICKAIATVLGDLNSLQRHIWVMVQYFSSLSDKINILWALCNEEFKEITENPDEERDRETMKELRDYANSIKAFSMVVYAMSSAYASISKEQIFLGFQLTSSLGNWSWSDSTANEHIERAAGELKIYRDTAVDGIQACVRQNKQELFRQLQKIYPDLKDDSPLNPLNQVIDTKGEPVSAE